MLGYTLEEMASISLLEVLDDEGRDQGAAFLARQRQAGGTTESAECLLLKRDRQPVWTVISHSPWRNEDGEYLGLIAFVNDITERRRLSDELRRREEQLAEAQRVAHLGSWEWDIAADELHWSDEMYRIFQLTPGGIRRHVRRLPRVGASRRPGDDGRDREGLPGRSTRLRVRSEARRQIRSGGGVGARVRRGVARRHRTPPVDAWHRARHHRLQRGRARARSGAGHRLGRSPRQVRLPGHHEPRDPDADERRHRHGRSAAAHRPGRASASIRRRASRRPGTPCSGSSTTSWTSPRSRPGGWSSKSSTSMSRR